MMHRLVTTVLLTAIPAVPPLINSEEAKAAVPVLDDQTVWRFHATLRPPAVGTAENVVSGRHPEGNWVIRNQGDSSPLPGNEWIRPDFDDSPWSRQRGPFYGGYGTDRPAGVALLCLRGRFGVSDPVSVKDLKLSLTYRGGMLLYVNGKEISRADMPRGPIEPLTLANDYPRNVFVTPGGEALLPNFGARKPPAELLDRYEARIRRRTVNVPANVLRKGENVLAIELHRTAIPADLPPYGRGAWDTVGLLEAGLTAADGSAVGDHVGTPRGVQVWLADPWRRLEGDTALGAPSEKTGVVEMIAPRNGIASAQVVVGGREGFSGLSAKMSDLKSSEGATIPAGAVEVRYAQVEQQFIPLLDRPVDGATMQPIWLTADIPADARPGTYRGTLSIKAPGKAVDVPVQLTVYGWKVGNPRQWQTCVNLLQSPESVAGQYRVPLWSEKHFQLMEQSFALMGLAGNDVLGISAVGKSVFGDDPMIVFRKQGNTYVPEFRFVERYLELYDRYAGPPQFFSLNVWSYGMYYSGQTRDGGDTERRASSVPVVELRGSRLVPIEMPIYGEPGTEPVWRQVIDGLRGRIEELGWHETRLLLGTSGDAWPSAITVNFFKKIAPDAQWRSLTHGGGCPKWGISDHERTQPNDMVVGYLEIARRLENTRVKRPEHPVACNARDNVGTNPFTYRGLAVTNTITTNYDGLCWKGIDYWTYLTPEGTKRNALNTYVHFGNMVGGTPRAMAWPGPDGAVATVQFEMLRQGIQDCEAVLAIQANLKTLYPPPVKIYDVVNLSLKGALPRQARRDGKQPKVLRAKDLDLAILYSGGETPGEILPSARTYNHGRHQGEIKVLPSDKGEKFDIRVTLGDDNWVLGGPGRFVVRLERSGDQYTGSYDGSFRGEKSQGAVTGSFTPQGRSVSTGEKPVENELTRRCRAVVEDVSRTLSGKAPTGGLRDLMHRLYATATDVAGAIEAKP